VSPSKIIDHSLWTQTALVHVYSKVYNSLITEQYNRVALTLICV